MVDLKEIIERSGNSQAEWARKLGVSRGYLHQIINRKKTPSLKLALEIQRLTGGAVAMESWVASGNSIRATRQVEDAA